MCKHVILHIHAYIYIYMHSIHAYTSIIYMNIHACKCISQFISLLILYFVDRSIAPTSGGHCVISKGFRPTKLGKLDLLT